MGRVALSWLANFVTDFSVSSVDESVSSITSSFLKRARSHDEEAWERIVHVYGLLVYKWCLQKGLPRADAADVGQEVLAAVYRKLPDFHRDRAGDTFRGWLRTITTNKIRDYWRRRLNEPAGVGGGDAQHKLQQVPFPETEVIESNEDEETKLLYGRIVELIRGLFAERDWQAFMRVVGEERRPAEVAEELGMTTNQVYLAKSRILRRIREEFGDEVDP